MGKITKAEIVDAIFNKTNFNRKDIHSIVNTVFEEISNALVARKVIELRGFGTFEIRVRKGREKARNPKTGEKVSFGSHGTVIFRPGRDLKQDVWGYGSETDSADTGIIQTDDPDLQHEKNPDT